VENPPTHQMLLLCEKPMPVVNGTLYAKCKTKRKQTKGPSQWSQGAGSHWEKVERRRPPGGHKIVFLAAI